MPPKNRNFAFQQLMNQMAAPSDTTGSFRNVTRDELFPGVISRDFARSRAADPTVSKYDAMYGGNPVMDLAQNIYQGGVGDTRGTGGMPGSGSDPMNYTEPAEMITGSFRNTTPRAELYDLEMNDGLGMPGSGSFGSFTPDRSAANIVEQSNPLMQLRGFNPEVNLPNLVGNDYPDTPTPSFRQDVLPPQDTLDRTKTLEGGSSIADTDAAYQQSLPGINVAQAFANRDIKNTNDATYQRGLEDNPFLSQEESLEDFLPRDYKAEAGQVADKVAKGVGGLAGGVARFGGNMLNAFLYGAQNKKGLRENLNQTFYGGKGTLGQNVLGLPAPQSNAPQTTPQKSQGIGPTQSGEPMGGGGFKSAFAAARKAGKKTFKWKNPRTGKTITYTTALASNKKKENDPSALQGSFRRVKPTITSPLLTGKGYR